MTQDVSALDRYEFTQEEVGARLHAMFVAAKASDEFEFCCTLLRVRGMESDGWDPFDETHRLVEDLMALVSAPLVGYTKIRLGLLLYSHLTEVGSIYDMLANLARVVAGNRYVIDPFLDYYPRNRKGEAQFLSTPGKVRALNEMLTAVDQAKVGELLDWLFHASLRNAFAHADYTLHEDRFRSRSQTFVLEGMRTSELPLPIVGDLVNRVLAFYDAFMTEYSVQRRSYKADKVVGGRISGGDVPEPVELLGDPKRGLYGFRSPPCD